MAFILIFEKICSVPALTGRLLITTAPLVPAPSSSFTHPRDSSAPVPDKGFPGTPVNEADAAFSLLFETWHRLVFSTALRRLDGDSGRAQEVTQNVFLTAHRKPEILAGVTCPAAWFHRAAMLESSNFLRAERRRRRALDAFAEEQAATLPAAVSASSFPDLTAASGTPPAIPEALRSQLDEALDTLRDPDRELVLSRFFEGRSFQEIAARRRSTPDAVRVKLNRILEKLATLLRRRGLAVTTVALTAAFTTQWTHAAPAALASTLTAAAAGTVCSTGSGSAATTATVGTASTTTAATAAFSTKTPFLLTLMSSGKTIGLTALALLMAMLSLQPQAARIGELQAKLAYQTTGSGRQLAANRNATAFERSKAPAFLTSGSGNLDEDTRPVTAQEVLKQVRSFQENGFDNLYPLPQLAKRLAKMSTPELLNLLSGIDTAQGGAGLKNRAREQLVSGFLVKKDPMAAIQQANRLRFQDDALQKLAANLIKTEKEAGVEKLSEFLKNPESFPSARFGSDPARAFRQGIAEGLAGENQSAAIRLCREAAGTPAAADYLRGMASKVAPKENPDTIFELLGGVPGAEDRSEILSRLTAHARNPEEFVNDPRFPQGFRKDAVLTAALDKNSTGMDDTNLGALYLIASASRPEDRQATTVDWLSRAIPPANPERLFLKMEKEQAYNLVAEALRLAAPVDPEAVRKWLVLIQDSNRRAALAIELNLAAP